ncbi:MAG: hypothetical protein AAGI66_06310, partial [Cyanobacteria bacterium P01_H01_bin.74]
IVATTLFAFIALFLVHGAVFNSLGTAAFRTMHALILTHLYSMTNAKIFCQLPCRAIKTIQAYRQMGNCCASFVT